MVDIGLLSKSGDSIVVSYLRPLTRCGKPWGGKKVPNYPLGGYMAQTDWPGYHMCTVYRC